MINKLKNSFAFRSGPLYRFIIQRILKSKYVNKKKKSDFQLITMAGIKHTDMLNECLLSIFRSWDQIPEIIVYADDENDIDILKKKLNHLKDLIIVKSWTECLSTFDSDKKNLLMAYANIHPIGKKFCTILHHVKKSPTMWCDADILWFKDFSGELTKYAGKSAFITATEDYQPAYSKVLPENIRQILKTSPYINTGIVIANFDKGLLDHSFEYLSQFQSQSHFDHFSEQTTLGAILKDKHMPTLPADSFVCFQSDILSIKPSYLKKNWICRHYVGPVRHIFWRDAFFLRLGIKA